MLPVPVWSQKMSGLLWSRSLSLTRLLLAGEAPGPPLWMTTPPEAKLGPVGLLPDTSLSITLVPSTPTSAMPIPEVGGPSEAGHAWLLAATVLSSMVWKPAPVGPVAPCPVLSARIPTQFPHDLLSSARILVLSRRKMPNPLWYAEIVSDDAVGIGRVPHVQAGLAVVRH